MGQTPVRIGGTPVTATGSIEVRNPFDGEVIGLVPSCTAADVDRACTAAAAALARDDFPQHRRARVLEIAAGLLRDRIETLAATICADVSLCIRTARANAAQASGYTRRAHTIRVASFHTRAQ